MTSTARRTTLTALDPASYRHMPWKNGGGVTTDIAVSMRPGFAPGGWDGIIWRFSRTAIVTPGAFSDLGGYDRELAVVSGEGLVLETADGEIDVRRPFKPVRFAGETGIVSRLEAGPVEVVNLIGDRASVSIALHCLSAGATAACPAGIHVILAAAGSCELSIDGVAREIVAGHAMCIDSATQIAIAGRLGAAVVASIIPAST